MSATKRYIDDKCEEIAKMTGLSWDEVMDIFNEANENLTPEDRFVNEDIIWGYVKDRARVRRLLQEGKTDKEKDPIKTGYIPVEYNHYKELIRKAKAYDEMNGLFFNLKPDDNTYSDFMSGKTDSIVLTFGDDVDYDVFDITKLDVYDALGYNPGYHLTNEELDRAAFIIIDKEEG